MENLDDLLVELGCKVGSLSFSYLGLPLGAPFKSTAAWDGVKERFHKRLSMWKRQYISKEGRITLFEVFYLACPIILYLCFVCQGLLD